MIGKQRDPERERRIHMEIVVDANGPEEQAMGWYYYLQERLQCPFPATCIHQRAISPLKVKDKVHVLEMPPEEECEHEMFVTIRWGKGRLAVPLSQLKPTDPVGEETREAVEDWHYWVGRGYEF